MAVYELITKKIAEMLDKGVVPWHCPWKVRMPMNLVTRKPYRGVNILTLAFTGYASPYWLTQKQANRLGGSVKEGERSLPVVYWKWMKVTGKDGKEKNVPLLKYHDVFNAQQCEGIAIPQDDWLEFNPIEECEKAINGMPQKPTIHLGGYRACYIPAEDAVRSPHKENFESVSEFYSTLFHELVHATGHEKRLNRKSIAEPHAFGSETYSNEELVAELGASFLCGITGIGRTTIQNQVGYISGWLNRLKKDKRLIVMAASQAQKACDFILNTGKAEQGGAHGKSESEICGHVPEREDVGGCQVPE